MYWLKIRGWTSMLFQTLSPHSAAEIFAAGSQTMRSIYISSVITLLLLRFRMRYLRTEFEFVVDYIPEFVWISGSCNWFWLVVLGFTYYFIGVITWLIFGFNTNFQLCFIKTLLMAYLKSKTMHVPVFFFNSL